MRRLLIASVSLGLLLMQAEASWHAVEHLATTDVSQAIDSGASSSDGSDLHAPCGQCAASAAPALPAGGLGEPSLSRRISRVPAPVTPELAAPDLPGLERPPR
ncbi:MAG: hypothetical protein RML32_07185 [Gammaproteobacteria bacterium]|nr:hypothetical protein [Gammaproteobacteria bacterium]